MERSLRLLVVCRGVTSPPLVIQIMACSPHEEAAVYRLLLLGYPMNKLTDYKFLAYAGRKHRQEKKAMLRKLHEEALAQAEAQKQARGAWKRWEKKEEKGLVFLA